MPKSPTEILSDPQFHALPLGEQLKVMQTVDPNFASLSAKDQGTVIAKSRQKSLGYDKIGEKPKDAGFGTTLMNDVASIPGALMATGTGEKGDSRPPGIVPQIGAAQHEQFEKGRQDFKQGNYVSGAGRTLAGALPVVGPIAAQMGDEIGSGQYGQAAAHGVEMLAPEIPGGKLARAGGDVAKAAGKAMPDIHPLAKMAAKRVPGIGTAIDIGEFLKKKYGKADAPKPLDPKARIASMKRGAGAPWRDIPDSQADPVDATPIPGNLPSGRKAGPAPAPEAPPPSPGPLPKRLPNWHMVRDPKISSPAPVEPIKGELPSGRKPGGLPSPVSVDPSVNESQASSMAGIMKTHGIDREAAKTMTPQEWQLVASNAGLKVQPSADAIQAAIAKLDGGPAPLRVRRKQAGR